MQTNFFSRYSTWVGHVGFFVLAVMAILYYKERTLILDAAFQSFEVIRKESFAIQVNRFGAAMTQIFPLLALKLKLPFKGLLIMYSLSFVLVHWAMFTICDAWLKIKPIAFAIFLFTFFLVNDTFYWVQNEVIQGTSLCLLFWAAPLKIKDWRSIRWWHVPIGLFLCATLAFFHPLIIFPFSFAAAYFFLDGWKKNNTHRIQPGILLAAALAFFAFIALKYQVFPNNYDNITVGRFSINKLSTLLSNLTDTNAYKNLMAHLTKDFYLLPLALAAITIFYVRKRRLVKLAFVWLSVVAYLLIVMTSYIEGGFWFHVESQYLPISIFLLLPLVWEVFPDFSSTKKGLIVSLALVILAFAIRVADIVQTGAFYEKRVDFIGATLRETWRLPGNKFLLQDSLVDKTYLLQPWSFAYESLYYSALQSPDSTRSILLVTDLESNAWALELNKSFYAYGNLVGYDTIPRHLFNFTDTTNTYRAIRPEDWNSHYPF